MLIDDKRVERTRFVWMESEIIKQEATISPATQNASRIDLIATQYTIRTYAKKQVRLCKNGKP
jgi:hypothetical protein